MPNFKLITWRNNEKYNNTFSARNIYVLGMQGQVFIQQLRGKKEIKALQFYTVRQKTISKY